MKPPTKNLRFKKEKKNTQKEIMIMEEDCEEDKNVEETLKNDTPKTSNTNEIPALYVPYYNKAWFPRGIGFKVTNILKEVISRMDADQPFALKEMYNLIGDINKYGKLSVLKKFECFIFIIFFISLTGTKIFQMNV